MIENTDKRLPQEVLKIIACITMLIDHFGHAIVPCLSTTNMVDIYYTCRIIGRMAFPIYCFLLVEGMYHTKNAGKYILRLAIGMLIAELPFDMLFEGHFCWASQSVMVTLTLGAVMLWLMNKTENKLLQAVTTVPFALLAELAKCDYGGWGIAMIAMFAIIEQLPFQIMLLGAISVLMPSAKVAFGSMNISVQMFSILGMLPIYFYSGEKLTDSKAVQWAFYLFYPLHILILWLVLQVLG